MIIKFEKRYDPLAVWMEFYKAWWSMFVPVIRVECKVIKFPINKLER